MPPQKLLETAPHQQQSQELHLVVFQTAKNVFSTVCPEPEGLWPLLLLPVCHKAEDLGLW